jgi:hypothetical protein
MKIKCPDLKTYFEERNKLIKDGYIEVPSNVRPQQGENIINFDGIFFSLTTPEKEVDTRQEKIGMICCIVMILIAALAWIL